MVLASSFLSQWNGWIGQLWPGLVVSLKLTGASLAIGLPGGVLLAVGQSVRSRVVRAAILVIVEVGRGIPTLIVLYIVYFGLPHTGLTFTAFVSATITLAIGTAAYTSEMFRAGLLAVPRGQHEAAQAIGLSQTRQLLLVVLPQAIRIVIPPVLGFSIIVFQGTALAFSIALPELLSRAYNIGSITFAFFSVLLLAGLMYASVAIPVAQLVALLERRTGSRI